MHLSGCKSVTDAGIVQLAAVHLQLVVPCKHNMLMPCRLVCAEEGLSYSSLRTRVHSPTAAGVLSALHAALPSEQRADLAGHFRGCRVDAQDRLALQELLLLVRLNGPQAELPGSLCWPSCRACLCLMLVKHIVSHLR